MGLPGPGSHSSGHLHPQRHWKFVMLDLWRGFVEAQTSLAQLQHSSRFNLSRGGNRSAWCIHLPRRHRLHPHHFVHCFRRNENPWRKYWHDDIDWLGEAGAGSLEAGNWIGWREKRARFTRTHSDDSRYTITGWTSRQSQAGRHTGVSIDDRVNHVSNDTDLSGHLFCRHYSFKYNQNPNTKHQAAVKRVIRYLKGTMDHGITYGTANGLEGYKDADWASDQKTRRSLEAYVFLLYDGAVNWTSKRQQSIALSSCEAEYMAQTQTAKEAIWLTRLQSELNIGFGRPAKPVLLKADDQGAIALTKDPRFHSRTKHIDIRWHFVRDQVETGAVRFECVPTGDMAADGLTKALTNDIFAAFVRQIGLKKSE